MVKLALLPQPRAWYGSLVADLNSKVVCTQEDMMTSFDSNHDGHVNIQEFCK